MLSVSIEYIHRLCNYFVHFFFFSIKEEKKEQKKKKQQSISALPDVIALTEWMYVPFASQTKSFSAAKDNAAHLLLPLLGEGWDGEFFNIRFFGLKPSE